MNKLRIIYNGLVVENPTFVLLLGMCPTLGTTGSAMNGMSMGLATMGVFHLFQYRYLGNQEPRARQGAYPGVYCRDCHIRDAASDDDAGLSPRA